MGTREGEYAFAEDAAHEAARLDAVQRAFDDQSRAALAGAGVRSGWRCWEVGAGRGSIARWLADVVGPQGHVLATDLDDRWFASTGAENLEFRRHDVTRDQPPASRLDLIHARFLLEHLADPRDVIARLAAALKPGGVLVVEDSAGLEIELEPPDDVFDRLASAWRRAGASVGWDAAYGRALIGDLRGLGLIELRGVEYRQFAPGGPAWEHLRSGLHRLRSALLEQGADGGDLARALAALGDPANQITGPPVVIASGAQAAAPTMTP
jgi:SAM-dependent methyltransferase